MGFKWGSPAMKVEEYRKHDAISLAGLIAKGEVSAEEVLETAIARAEQVNPAINAIVHKQYEQARKAVAAGLPEGPLKGVPYEFAVTGPTGRDPAHGCAARDDAGRHIGVGGLVGGPRQIGVISSETAHIRVTEIGHKRGHHGAGARACSEIDELLVDRDRVLACEIGRVGLAQAAGAVAHGATQSQCCAPPDCFRACAFQHLRDDLDARRRVIATDNLPSGRCVPNESDGTADRVPDPAEPLALLLERQPGEAGD